MSDFHFEQIMCGVCVIKFEVSERLLVIERTLCEVSETGGHLLGG